MAESQISQLDSVYLPDENLAKSVVIRAGLPKNHLTNAHMLESLRSSAWNL